MKRYSIGVIILIVTGSWCLAGTKEEIIRLQSDVLQLQNQIRMLQKSFDERNEMIISLLEQLNDQAAQNNVALRDLSGALRGQTADLSTSLTQVRDDFQLIGVKMDETHNRLASLHKKIDDNQMQVQSLRSVTSEDGSPVEPDRVYFAAQTDYQMGNYELAIAGFQDFLATYPDSELADNAAYYLGASFLRQGRPELAVQAFDQVINLYPKGDKSAVAYYKKAVALEEMQRMEDAIDTLQTLKKLFPDSPEANLAQAELDKLGIR